MNQDALRNRRLASLEWACGLLLIPATLAWLINIEMALKVVWPAWAQRDRLLASPAFDLFYRMAADLSTISTLVIVLILFFPLLMARRVRAYAQHNPDRMRRLVYDPYPPHFPFFLVMLGLVGTLYGLLIGLTISGVTDLGARAASPSAIQDALDQLLDGTATALLSSLWGLVGAFVAARPMTWLFHWAACLPGDEEPVMLSDTLRRLNNDLAELGHTARAFQERLGHSAIETIPVVLGEMRDVLNAMRDDSRTAQEKALAQQAESARQALDVSQKIATALSEQTTLLRDIAGHMEHQRGQIATLTDAAKEAVTAQQQAAQQRERMVSALDAEKDHRARDRQSLRLALQQFLGPEK